MGHDIDVYPNRSQEIVAAVRSALGPHVPLMVDANSGFTRPETALDLANFLVTHNVTWFEEPCVWNDLQCARAVMNSTKVPVALGGWNERWSSNSHRPARCWLLWGLFTLTSSRSLGAAARVALLPTLSRLQSDNPYDAASYGGFAR